MVTKRKKIQLSVLLALAAFVCGFFGANAAQQAPERVKVPMITLGIVSATNQTLIAHHFGDFVRYVGGKLNSGSVVEGKVVLASTPFQLARLIEQRKVDFYMDSPYPTYLINDVQGVAKLLLRRWKSGMAEYRSLIFTKKNGEINRLEDLRGKTFAFEDPESTSGHFLPRHFMTRKGFKFADKSRFDPYASPTDVDYARLDEKRRSEITILAETERLPRNLVSVRKDFAPALTDRLEKILLSMNEDDQGRKILKKTDDTTKFDLLPEREAGLRRRLAEIFQSPKKN